MFWFPYPLLFVDNVPEKYSRIQVCFSVCAYNWRCVRAVPLERNFNASKFEMCMRSTLCSGQFTRTGIHYFTLMCMRLTLCSGRDCSTEQEYIVSPLCACDWRCVRGRATGQEYNVGSPNNGDYARVAVVRADAVWDVAVGHVLLHAASGRARQARGVHQSHRNHPPHRVGQCAWVPQCDNVCRWSIEALCGRHDSPGTNLHYCLSTSHATGTSLRSLSDVRVADFDVIVGLSLDFHTTIYIRNKEHCLFAYA